MNRRLVTAAASSLLLLAGLLPGASAADPVADRSLPDSHAGTRLANPRTVRDAALDALDKSILEAGRHEVIVRLSEAATTDVSAQGVAAEKAQTKAVTAEQAAVLGRAKRLDPRLRVLGSTQRTINAIMVSMDAAAIRKLAADPSVESIRPVKNYTLSLDETVPYIGAAAVQAAGFDGTGLRVAVLDSGIDYTHVAFGGAGTAAAYEAAYGTTLADARNKSLDGLFPTAKVVGGFDFVGEGWPTTALAPDPDPIDCGSPPIPAPCAGGHGTHVADIIAGAAGVAPGASLYAVKVCSAVSTSCSGVALIEAMDFAIDPNGDGSTADAVDIINMSLGSDYGQAPDDDLSAAVDAASKIGVLTVAAAGNGADRPYVAGTPANAPSALSVAQTNVPSATQPLLEIVSPASIAGFYPAVFQPWSVPLPPTPIEAPVQYGNGAGGNLNGCAAFPAGSLAGKIVLVDRGACNFSAKIFNIGQAGGLVGIIGLIAAGDPFSGSFGGESPQTIPGFMISQALSNAIKANLATGVVVRFDSADALSLIGHMVGSSSRGPSSVQNLVKPEIGAPGASVSAIVGSGTGTGVFGGTSGASPMVAGAAALLLDAFPSRKPHEIKSLLMNTAETDVMNSPAFFGGDKAAITRIGGGEVRVERALASKAAAWDTKLRSGALSFGFVDATQDQTLSRQVTLRNYSNQRLTFDVSATFRFAGDQTGAVKVSAPKRVTVKARSSTTFKVQLRIDAEKLQPWLLDSGFFGNSSATLTQMEFDGYLWLNQVGTSADDADPMHLAWHVLPRLSGDVRVSDRKVVLDGVLDGLAAGDVRLRNRGAGVAPVDSYSLIATDPDDPDSGTGDVLADVDVRSVGVQTFLTNTCPGGFLLAFAIDLWDRVSHANAPAEVDLYLNIDQAGDPEFVIFNFDLSLSGAISDGRNVTWVVNLATDAATAFFFTDHGTNSGNIVMRLCAGQIGLTTAALLDPIGLEVQAFDWYNSGTMTDSVTGITFSPLGERYFGLFGPTLEEFGTDIPRNGSTTLTVIDFGEPAVEGTNPTETGLLLLTDAERADWRGGSKAANEAIQLPVVPDDDDDDDDDDD